MNEKENLENKKTENIKWDRISIKQFAKHVGISTSALIVLTQQNDPYYIGSISELRSAEWIAEIVQEYLNERGRENVHDRAIHYYILSRNVKRPFKKNDWRLFKGDSNDFHWVMNSIRNARILGLIPWDCIEDKKNPEPHINSRYWDHEDMDQIQITAKDIAKAVSNDDRFLVFNPQLQQPYHVEIWTEKTTINDILLPLGKKYGANIVTFSGQSTSTGVYELINRINTARKPARILYISDYDKYGHNMPVSCGRKIQWFLDHLPLKPDIKLHKILLTEEQVSKYKLPPAPDSKNKVEIDALEVYYPDETRKIVTKSLDQYIDLKVTTKIKEQNTKIQNAIYKAILEQKDSIGNLLEKLDLREVKDLCQNYELPKLKPRTLDGVDYIYDSDLDYINQVKKFKDYLGRRND